jgi:hypothetical protein
MRTWLNVLCIGIVVIALGGNAAADVIAFDDAYAVLGDGGDPNAFYTNPVFGGSYFGLVGGLGNGDPGNWDLEGTNGSAFLGTNSGYDGSMLFAAHLSEISLDVSRSAGSSAGQTFAIEYYSAGTMVGSELVTLGDINVWTTLSFNAAAFDEVRWQGSANGFSPFGIDNVVFTGSVANETRSWGGVKSLFR